MSTNDVENNCIEKKCITFLKTADFSLKNRKDATKKLKAQMTNCL